MSDLYSIVERIINAETLDDAEEIFYGIDGIKINSAEYYKNIISNFIKKREIVIKKVNGMLTFDLNNINDIYNIIFLAEYIKENDRNYDNYKDELNKIDEILNKEANKINDLMKNCVKGSSQWIKLSKYRSNVLKEKLPKIKDLKEKYESTLKIFEPTKNMVSLYKGEEDIETIIKHLKTKNMDIKESVFDDLKLAIHIIYKFRNTFEHGEEILPEEELKIDKQGFKFNIPIKYLDGFNKGRIIVEDKDKKILQKTNQKSQSILEYLGYDIKKIESFFYNVEPICLSYLLEKVNYDYNKLYELPYGIFINLENTKKLIEEYGFSLGDLCSLPYDAFKYPENTQKLKEEYGLEGLRLLPYGAFEHLENTQKLIDKYGLENLRLWPYFAFCNVKTIEKLIEECGFTLEDLSSLTHEAFVFPENTKKLKEECGFSVKDLYLLSYYAFKYPENTKKLIDEYDFTLEDLSSLPEYAFKYLENTKKLIDEYGFSPKDLSSSPYYSSVKPENIQKLIDEYGFSPKDLSSLPSNAFEYPENTKKLIEEYGLENLRLLPYGAFKYPESTKKLMDKYGLEYLHLLPPEAFANPEETLELKEKCDLSLEDLRSVPGGGYVYLYQFENIPYLNFLKLTKGIKFGKATYKKLQCCNLKEENLKFLISKIGDNYEKLEEFPVEFFECNYSLLEEMYKRYNSNLNKSIFGIDNPKIISLIVYMHSVFSKIDGKDINIDLNEFIFRTNYNTLKYKDNINAINMDQSEYINQIYNYNILEKLRNMSVHFRFKLVKDENNEDNLLYLYDEDNQGTNNFNIIINIKDLFEITKNIEEQIIVENKEKIK